MMVFLIGGAIAGVVLGASNRVVFLLPAALMALVVASVLIVRADLDVAFTASLLPFLVADICLAS